MKKPVTREQYDRYEKIVAEMRELRIRQDKLLGDMLLCLSYEVLWPGWAAAESDVKRLGLIPGKRYPADNAGYDDDGPDGRRRIKHVQSYMLEMRLGDDTRRFHLEDVPGALRAKVLDREMEEHRLNGSLFRHSEVKALRKEKGW